jgi:hypothetical protein
VLQNDFVCTCMHTYMHTCMMHPYMHDASTSRMRVLADRVVTWWSSRWRTEGLAQSRWSSRASTGRSACSSPHRRPRRPSSPPGRGHSPPPPDPISGPCKVVLNRPRRRHGRRQRERMKTRSYDTDGWITCWIQIEEDDGVSHHHLLRG